MKNLWAPWRVTYIESDKEAKPATPALEPCIFCRYPKEPKASDRDNLVLWRGEKSFVMLNRYPYSNTHLLIVPYEHRAKLELLSQDVHDELFRTVTKMTVLLEKALAPEGLNVGMNLGRCAGAGIADHLHVHIVPRWPNDGAGSVHTIFPRRTSRTLAEVGAAIREAVDA